MYNIFISIVRAAFQLMETQDENHKYLYKTMLGCDGEEGVIITNDDDFVCNT